MTLQSLITALAESSQVRVSTVNTTGIRGKGLRGMLRLATCWGAVLGRGVSADVITLHTATTALHSWGLLVWLAARILRKPLVIRKFATQDYAAVGGVRARLAHFVVLRTDVFLVETKQLLDLCRRRSLAQVRWFPTTRQYTTPSPPVASHSTRPCRRFIYVGHVCELKGIKELLTAAERMPDGVQVDVYGPILNDISPSVFHGATRTFYRGILRPIEVPSVMSQYDAAVLPTKAPSEGYPGMILEAFGAGLPVVATRCGAIPELVDESCGILVQPGEARELADAMWTMVADYRLFQQLRAKVFDRALTFATQPWALRFVDYCDTAVHPEHQRYHDRDSYCTFGRTSG